ncbi:XTP/dITP diphosphatase [Companilactobacillus sp. DQM5]|uniref:XTP/dITP diphosphatase n=1 Tax=Companilactobacillus sp. DQM5 TaxID=3463359 RepID=UPI004058F93F
MKNKIVIATNNVGKAKEFSELFKKYNLEIETLNDYPEFGDIPETGETFEENAKIKAHTVAKKLKVPVLADDSGLEVDALNGQPGVYSARYAGDHDFAANNAKLLSELGGIPLEKRTARFVSTLVLAHPEDENKDVIVSGSVEGLISIFPEGENGFGYDPLFYIPKLKKTMAEMSMEQKNSLSHRARALEKLEKSMPDWIN